MSEYAKLNGNIAAKKSVAGNVGIKDFYIGPKGDPGPRGEKGEKGDPGAIDFRIVPELPTDDYSESTIYLVPLSPGSENNEYAEYVFINGKPEYVGSATVEVDLSEYVKKDDFVIPNVASGVLKISSNLGFDIAPDGALRLSNATNQGIDNRTNRYGAGFGAITPFNLDYAVMKALSDSKLEWTDEQKQLSRALFGSVGSEDYATDNKVGLVKGGGNCGTYIHFATGTICIDKANKSKIDGKTDNYKPIVSSMLDYAVKKALSDCKLEGDDVWTEEEKAKALETLGGLQKIVSTGSFQRVYAIGQDGVNKPLNTSENPFANALVLFDAGGCVRVNVPTKDTHATTKKYVDDLVGSVETILTELHTYAQTKIGGEA